MTDTVKSLQDLANQIAIAEFGGDKWPANVTTIAEAAEEIKRLREAIRWALGERDDFRLRTEGEGAFWWRKELRERSGLRRAHSATTSSE